MSRKFLLQHVRRMTFNYAVNPSLYYNEVKIREVKILAKAKRYELE